MKTKIERRVRVLCKLVIFLVLSGISEIFTVRASNWRSHDKQEKKAKKDYCEASDSVLEIGYLLGSNRVQEEFHPKGSKGWLWWKAPKSMVKTKIQRLVFCKLVIVFFVMGFNKNFKVRYPKRRFDEIHQKTTVSDKNRWDTLTKRCFFPSRAPLIPLKVVYRSSVTKSCTPTLRGQGDPKVSQPFWLRL